MKITLGAIALLTLAACGYVHIGRGFSDSNGVVSYDGVTLPFHRWVEVSPVEGPTDHLALETGTGSITLKGGEALHLEVDLYSEVENDGSVVLKDGKPVATSASQHVVAINGVRGTVPAAVSFDLGSGTGEVQLNDLPDAHVVKIDGGTGDVSLSDCKVASLETDTGTGGLRLEGCTIDWLSASSGTGDVRVRNSHMAHSKVESGTGDVIVSGGSAMGEASYDLGTGRVRNGD